MAKPICTIIGYGPGLGAAYAKTFANAGYDLALVSRSGGAPDSGGLPGTNVAAFATDAGDPDALTRTLDAIETQMGATDVLIYNAGLAKFGTVDDITTQDYEDAWRVSALGYFTAARHVGAKMAERGSGNIIASGATASLRGAVWTTAFAPSKAAQRITAQSLAKQLWPKGVHVSYIIIDGVIDTEDTRQGFARGKPDEFFMDPNRIAEAALGLARQERSAWSFEIDLRPFGENW